MGESGCEIALLGSASDRAYARELLADACPHRTRVREYGTASELSGVIASDDVRLRAVVIVGQDAAASIREVREALGARAIARIVLARHEPSREQLRELLSAGATEVASIERASADYVARCIEHAIARVDACHGRGALRRAEEAVDQLRRTEQELRRSEALVRRMVESSPFPAIVHAEDGEILIVNPAWTKLSGYRHEDIPTLSAWAERAYGPERGCEVMRLAQESYGRDEMHDDGECPIRTANGETRIWSFHSGPLGQDPQGRRLALRTATDVTERARAEASLRAAERDLAFHVENSPLAVVEWGPDMRCIRWTGQAEWMFGWPASAVLGRSADEWRFVHDEDRPEVDAMLSRLADGCERQSIHINRNYRSDGTVGYYEWHNSVRLDEQGCLVSTFCLALDVTERIAAERALAESESRFRTIAEATPSLVFVLGRDGAYANSWWFEYFHVSFEDAMRAGWAGLIHPDDESSFLGRWARADGADETFELEVRLIRHDGEARWHLARTVPLRDATGRVVGRCCTATDVHRLKSAEEEVRRATELLRVVADTAPELIYAKDREGRLLLANPATERALGMSFEAFRGRDPHALGPASEAAAIREHDQEVMSSGQTREFDETMSGAQGPRLYRSTKTPLRDSAGAVVGLVGVSRDVTDQKRHEHALLVSEARAKDAAQRAEAEQAVVDAILEAAPVALMVADACGKIVRLNPATELLWGRMPPVRRVEDYAAFHGWWPDGAGRGRALEAHEWAITRALRGDTVHDDIVEIEPFDRPGTRRTVVHSAAPVRDAEGNVTGAVAALMDISELVATDAARRESEERFRALADNITQLAWIAEPDGSVTWFNRRWLEYTGASPEQMRGLRWQELVEPEHRARVISKLAQHFERGEPWEDTFPIRGADGARRWFLSHAAPIRDESGRVVRWFGTHTDVTAQREAEDALRESARRKDEFLSMLAHELRNPLAPLRFAVALLGEDTTGPALARARAVIDRQVRHMASLIDDLLDVSRVARGRIELRKEVCDAVALARQTAEDHRLRFEGRGVAFVVSTGTEPLYVLADPVRITQMISNLLDNAAKYTERGGRVELRVERSGEAGVNIVVEDTGAGIDPDLLSRIFDPFAQADQGLARSKGGLGLGLALTRGLAQLHGGSVKVQSGGPGHGATFTISLPLHVTDESALPTTRAAPIHADGKPRRVLIVEDNPDAADLLATLLETAGHHTAIARDGAEGLTKAHEQRFDVVVCDLGLPGMSGYDVARELRRDPEIGGMRLIALSGYARDEDRARAKEAGFDEHLAKPVELDALLAQLSPPPPSP